jgi:hypothetical protein
MLTLKHEIARATGRKAVVVQLMCIKGQGRRDGTLTREELGTCNRKGANGSATDGVLQIFQEMKYRPKSV